MTEPEFDPHREGKRGFLAGAVAAAGLVVALYLIAGLLGYVQ